MTTSKRGLFVATAATVLGASLSLVATAQVPDYEEPLHRLVFANETFLVLEPQIDPGATTLDHVHALDTATICISGSTMRNRLPGAEWGEPGKPCKLGDAAVSDNLGHPRTHRAQNLGATPLRMLAVESLKDGGWSSAEPIAAPFTKILKESRAFRIYTVQLRAGESTAHVHQSPIVTVLVSGELVSERENPKESVHLRQPGRWSLVPQGQPHTLRPGPAGEVVAYEIEVR